MIRPTPTTSAACARRRRAPTLRSASLLGLALVLLAHAACDDTSRRSPAQPAATPVGTPIGASVSAIVGLGGGTLSSADGRVSLVVPAGAVAVDTAFAIQPLTNEAHGGTGAAYRLTPEGQTFAVPVELRFAFADEDVRGSVEDALGVAFQRADGRWEWAGAPTIDTTAKTVTVATTHFSDWSLVKGFQILPQHATVEVRRNVTLEVVYCYDTTQPDDLLAPLGYRCDRDTGDDLLAPLHPVANVSEWAVNGVPGGNGTTGTVAGDASTATFTAPADVPTPNTVAVSARMDRGSRGETLVVAEIEILRIGDYAGTLDFTTSVVTGTAHVTWTKFEDLGDVRRYLPSGTMDVTLHPENCDAVQVSLPIDASSPSAPGSTLVVYTASNVAYPKQYQYTLRAAGDVTLSCGTPRQSVTYPASYLTTLFLGSCPGTSFATYTDEALLAVGSYACVDHGIEQASWSFAAQSIGRGALARSSTTRSREDQRRSRRRYPTPGSVSSNVGRDGSRSTFLRSSAMCTRT